MDLAIVEQMLDEKFYGPQNWELNVYLSPAEQQRNKPILPTTDPTTGRMGHARNYPGPDTALVEALYIDVSGNEHTGVFTNTELALQWLLRQDQGGLQVKL